MLHGIRNQYLYSAVQITCEFQNQSQAKKTISGTAFFIFVGGILHLVTNRHVVDLRFKDEKYRDFSPALVVLRGRFSGDILRGCEVPISANQIIYSKNELNDFVCIPSPRVMTATGPAITIDHSIPESMIATENDFQNDISVCDFVAFPGYPQWHDEVESRPIFRGGTIASDPRTNYSYRKVMGDCIAYEAFSFDGSSGSPVFAMQKGIKAGAGLSLPDYRPARFIGINAGHLPSPSASHSGISYFYKSSAILKTIEDASKGDAS
jgi:hypothetical protein